MVYSTCSFSSEENEVVVLKLVQCYGDVLLVEAIKLPLSNIQAGITQWQKRNYDDSVKHCVRILPNELMDGFFLCKIRKLKSTV